MRGALIVLLPVVPLLAALPARADMEPGNWEISSSTELAGMQPMQLTQTRCLTEEDAKNPSRLFGPAPGAQCQYTRRDDSGSVFSFEVACGEVRGTGRVQYSAASMDGELELTRGEVSARSRISARRLGGC